MRTKSSRSAAAAALAGVAALAIGACGGSKPKPPAAPPKVTVSDRCPNLAKPDEVGAFDFAKSYQLSREAADKLKAAALAATEITTLAQKLDANLGIACANVASTLGAKGDWRSGDQACSAAIKAVSDARAKLGKKATTELVVRTPVCLAPASLMTKCASICDSSVPAERIKADCEQKAGRCDGKCDGVCEPKAPTKCEGTCAGTCDGKIEGSCGGRCKGKCDGRRVNGACTGTCVGTCSDGAMSGQCDGLCAGSCKLAGPSICAGLCSGTCSVDLADAKCAGGFKTPDVSTDCRARCELAVMNETECSKPQVSLVVKGSHDRKKAGEMKEAVERAFPELLQILFELGDEGRSRVLNAQAVIEGARTGFKDMARSGGQASAEKSEAQLVKCFDEPFKKAAAAATTVKKSLDQAAGIREEMTKSPQ